MSIPAGWQEVTGEGHVDFSAFETVNDIVIWLPNDTDKTQFIGTDLPRRIRFAGGIGLGGYGDTFPDSLTTHWEQWYWWWLEFEAQAFFLPSGGVGASFFNWKLPSGINLWYYINL